MLVMNEADKVSIQSHLDRLQEPVEGIAVSGLGLQQPEDLLRACHDPHSMVPGVCSRALQIRRHPLAKVFDLSADILPKPRLNGQPASCSVLVDRATVGGLALAWQEPAFAPFEQATAAAGMPAARTGWLTRNQDGRRLGMAHERDLLPIGQVAGRWHFPPPLCADSLGGGGRQPSGMRPLAAR